MFGEICCCTLLYVLFSLVIIFPPQEAISSGITIENLMNFWLGSESHSFIYYQIKRTVVTLNWTLLAFTRIDKVSSDINSISRIIATENWLIKITSYKIHLIALRDALLVIESTQEAPIIPNSTSPAQLISIRVTSLKESVKGFTFKVNSSIWGDLEKKLVNPVVNTKHLVIHQTLADRFVAVFEEAVQKNPKVKLQTEQESCIGCMGVKANIVLDRRCLTVNDKSSCRQCSCKPMWCLTCLGKWFAARQDPNETETWLSSSAPCPTCRSKFCLLDVFLIEE
ncbi:E3 ubiquitin-protein ligase [Armadillidium vulgare]|nr:E3 ubiquitin-protein ligase [Armadillidium vulgare]